MAITPEISSERARARYGIRTAAWLRTISARLRKALRGPLQWVGDVMPKGLYARALIIIIAPIVVLEGVIAFVFMERHWQAVTRRLSEATARDIAALIQVYEQKPPGESGEARLIELARDKSCRPASCPNPVQSPFSACSMQPCPTRSASASIVRSGSIRSASRATSKSASSSTPPSFDSSQHVPRHTHQTRTSSCCGWLAPR